MAKNAFGHISCLQAESYWQDGNRLKNVHFTSPFKIMSPIETAQGRMKLIQMSVSAGIMAGDEQQIDLNIGQKTRVEWTSQSYEKVHRMYPESFAKRTLNITQEANSELYYCPLPTIPFADSDFRSKATVKLADTTSKLVYCDILSGGRVAMGEVFGMRRYYNLLQVYRGEQLIYRENTDLFPEKFKLDELSFFEGYTHTGTMLFCGYNNLSLAQIRMVSDEYLSSVNNEEILCGISQLNQGDIIVKSLGFTSQSIENFFKRLQLLVEGEI